MISNQEVFRRWYGSRHALHSFIAHTLGGNLWQGFAFTCEVGKGISFRRKPCCQMKFFWNVFQQRYNFLILPSHIHWEVISCFFLLIDKLLVMCLQHPSGWLIFEPSLIFFIEYFRKLSTYCTSAQFILPKLNTCQAGAWQIIPVQRLPSFGNQWSADQLHPVISSPLHFPDALSHK